MERLIRRKAYFVCLVAVLLLTASMVSQASAASVTYDVSFTASNFTKTGGTVPQDPVTGSFTITFDPTLDYSINIDSQGTTAGIAWDTGNAINITVGSLLSFSYSTTADKLYTGSTANELVVGGLSVGAGGVQYNPATNDFWLHIRNFTTAPAFGSVGYAQVAAGDFLFTDYVQGGTGSVTVTQVVPLPPTVFLLGSGILGLVGWRRFRKV